MAYLEKHGVAPMLNGLVNDLAASKPDDPISFLINGLLKEATARGQEVALMARLREIKETLAKESLEVKGGGGGGAAAAAPAKGDGALAEENEKLKYRVKHLLKTLDDFEENGGGGGGGGGGGSGADLPEEKFSARVAVGTILKASDEAAGKAVVVSGWVKTNRSQKKLIFMSINDGSCQANLQLIIEKDQVPPETWDMCKSAGNGSAVRVTGKLKASPAKGQKWELPVETIEMIGPSDGAKYPIPPTKINLETLRAVTHMRPRTGVMGAVMRVRNVLAYATHTFFQKSGFMYVHAPLITGADCEGAGEMFQVTTLDLAKPLPKTPAGGVDYAEDFFGKPSYLTVSGQLNGEYFACAFGSIYTFGPTFRAENSNTTRHLAEFWMIEPEIAFCDLSQNMDCAEGYLRHCFRHVLKECADDLAFLEEYEQKNKEEAAKEAGEELDDEPKLRERLQIVADNDFVRISYTEAVEIVSKVPGPKAGVAWVYPPKWGEELQTEHEKYLAEVVYRKPCIVYNYPKGCKAFYMRLNDDDATVGAMDVLFPRVGEMVGGSQREERLDVLLRRMGELGLKEEDYSAYLDTRRFGSQPHSGFGVGFERLVLYATAMGNIRDVIPFPRTVGQMLH